MTIAVDLGRKATKQTNKQGLILEEQSDPVLHCLLFKLFLEPATTHSSRRLIALSSGRVWGWAPQYHCIDVP